MVTGATEVAPFETESVRPDLPIPMVALGGAARVLQRLTVGSADDSFEQVRRTTVVLAVVAGALLVAAETILAPGYTTAVRVLGALLAAYAILRTVTLQVLERRQVAFEPGWLAQRSSQLRRHRFEVLRFSAQSDVGSTTTDWGFFDLTKAGDVRELLRLQRMEQRGQIRSRALIEFAYDAGPDGSTALETVSRALPDIDFHPVAAHSGRAWVRFPDAVYGSRPPRPARHQPARSTFWFLTGPVRITLTAPEGPA